MDTPVKIETFPWDSRPGKPMGLRVEGSVEGKRVVRFWVRTLDEMPWYLDHIERVTRRPIDFDWQMQP